MAQTRACKELQGKCPFNRVSSFQVKQSGQVIRDLELLPQLLGQDWSSVFVQRFDGAVTYVSIIQPHDI